MNLTVFDETYVTMGCCQSAESKAATERSQMIDKYLLEDAWRVRNKVNMMVVGSDESGKSTLMKQIKILFDGGYSEGELKRYRAAVHCDIIRYICHIVRAMDRLGITFGDVARADDARQLPMFARGAVTEELAGVIQRLWDDEGVQACFSRSHEYQLSNSASYFLNNLGRMCQSDYIPTQQDMLWTKANINTILEYFPYRDWYFTIVDMQNRWLIRKIDITFNVILFSTSLCDYDGELSPGENYMHFNIQLLRNICRNRWMQTAQVVLLFLNKKDLFEQKISQTPLTICFPEYRGSNTYEEAAAFIQEQFESQCGPERRVFTQFTCATDTKSINIAFNAAADFILQDTTVLCC
ncbi:guanine nucleotide-binding protein G(i) subunit alpha-3-like [Bombina bombina]|uniref:guanine nucleotide-binding protein G(i) subunit alpha-3-like n=1 Tax=Bombina bombina TaxID=8345 RepID=UPI00235AA13B|nr:guanine nucleotide-binding protein G(i) subunit alpha-3-like [Bombina bombina]